MKLTICHLYPDLMSTYGDRGNIITLERRAAWRGIEVETFFISIGGCPDFASFDIILFGGGQDKEQRIVCQDLAVKKGTALIDAVESGVVVLAVCGGYQLLGQYYRTSSGEDLVGVGVLDVRTEAGDKRFIGNVVMEPLLPLGDLTTVVGFENHSGRTYLGPRVSPFGKVVVGHGNNGNDGLEGCMYKNVFGTYLHGPLLPKNPHLADYLIRKALSRRHREFELSSLDDNLEIRAHRAAVAMARRASAAVLY